MTRGIPAGRLLGVPLRIGPSWLVLLPLLGGAVFAGIPPDIGPAGARAAVAAGGTLGILGAVVLHEVGHIWAARRRRVSVTITRIFLIGGHTEMDLDDTDPATEIWVAVSGSLASAATALLLWPARIVAPSTAGVRHVLGVLILVNAAMAVLNLLPGFPLDGGRVVRGLLRSIGWGGARAEWITGWIGGGVGVLMMGIGAVAALDGRPQAMILVPAGGLLVVLGVMAEPMVRMGDVMVPAPPPVKETDRVGKVAAGSPPIPVVAGERLVGVILPGTGPGLAGEVMRPVLAGDLVSSDLPVDEAAHRPVLVVVDAVGRVLGIVAQQI